MYRYELTKREQMDRVMAETRKRKTRRGKKTSYRRSTLGWAYKASPVEWCPDGLDLAKSYNNNSLRPVSPKAPLNSTQFLIEDRESLEMFETSPEQTLDEEVYCKLNEQDLSIHSEVTNSQRSPYSEDSYYEPLWVTEGSEFMLKEFERDYSAAFELETNFDYHLHILDSLSKEEIVQKYMDLDRRFRNSEKKFNHSNANSDKSSKSFKQTLAELHEENRRLLEENQKLKSALLLRKTH